MISHNPGRMSFSAALAVDIHAKETKTSAIRVLCIEPPESDSVTSVSESVSPSKFSVPFLIAGLPSSPEIIPFGNTHHHKAWLQAGNDETTLRNKFWLLRTNSARASTKFGFEAHAMWDSHSLAVFLITTKIFPERHICIKFLDTLGAAF